jgi:hypothetical protein
LAFARGREHLLQVAGTLEKAIIRDIINEFCTHYPDAHAAGVA